MNSHGWEHISKEAKHLVRHMLRGHSKARYTVDQVLAHPWISKKEKNSEKVLRIILSYTDYINRITWRK